MQEISNKQEKHEGNPDFVFNPVGLRDSPS